MLPCTHDHVACFHYDGVGLAREIADYLGPSLGGGGAALLVGRRDHIDAAERLLSKAGLNLSDLLRREQLVVFDAESVLGSEAVERHTELGQLEAFIHQQVTRLVNRWGQLRAFVELVNLLAAERRHDDALQLEAFLTGLQREVPFDVLCSFEFKRFAPGWGSERAFQGVCDAHTDVYAADAEVEAPTIGQLRREVVTLRHRLSSLSREDSDSTRQIRGFSPMPAEGHAHLLPLGRLAEGDRARIDPELGVLTAGRLLNVVVHNLQNLMSMLRWNALSAEAMLTTDAPARDAITDILMGVERCTELTGDVLGITRGAAVEPVPLDDLVNGQRRLLTRVVGHKAKLGFELGCMSRVVLSRTALCQALTNLVVNACHAVGQGGHILVRTTTAAAGGTSSSAQQWAVLEVSDDGAGIEPAILARLFDDSFTTRATGSGLGLAIVRSVVEQARGRVEVESALGSGSAFRVLLPVWLPGTT